MCGRYASTRSREDLLETFKIEEALADEEKAPDYNVAPTKTSPTVLARPPRGADEDAVPVRQLRNLKWGLLLDLPSSHSQVLPPAEAPRLLAGRSAAVGFAGGAV
jgi:putative SOS response-associated peptidase YedK